MRKFVVLTLALGFIIAAGVLAAQQNRGPAAVSPGTPPPWAYGFASPAGPTAANPPAPAAAAACCSCPACSGQYTAQASGQHVVFHACSGS